MGLTTQYLQTSVHRYPPFLGPMMKVTDQDSGRLVDIEYDTLRTVAANLNNDRPLKSVQAGHLSAPKAISVNRVPLVFFAEPTRYHCICEPRQCPFDLPRASLTRA
ncbi:conserved hypothetical protein [Mesorhizobium ventifaucium]|uniref:RHS repeat protein n=1 Tax=Mesorhizobium ventifaucium TaxID=666020 RepID=A0ABN8JAT0_9HYPH|nr:conserved hypothetical protein [Mesorhizobium ventifaucium]